MKILAASVFALSMLTASAVSADVGVGAGVHIGDVGVGAHVGAGGDGRDDRHYDHNRHYIRYHHRHCDSWGWHNHHSDRYCRHWYR